jgi:hypothetical protein
MGKQGRRCTSPQQFTVVLILKIDSYQYIRYHKRKVKALAIQVRDLVL